MTVHSPDHLLLPALCRLAIAAGEAVMAVYDTDFAVEVKADASSVTAADVNAEAVILQGLATLSPGIPVIAEEQVAAGRVPAPSDSFYLVDPLDGTREFISRNGEFTVNIALVRSGVPVLGVVYAPALGVLYGGALEDGAVRHAVVRGELDEGRRIAVRAAPDTDLSVVASRSHGDPRTSAWLSRLAVGHLTSAGSSLKFGLLAEGVADLYPRFGRTMEWDTAAGDAVLRAAGGAVVGLDGKPLIYGKAQQDADTPYANPFFIAYGDPRLSALVAEHAEKSHEPN